VDLELCRKLEKQANAFWDEKWRELCLRLYRSGIPIAEYVYRLGYKENELFAIQKNGVIFQKIRYRGKRKAKIRWLIDKEMTTKQKNYLEWESQWIFLPLAIFSKGKMASLKNLKFIYKMQRRQYALKSNGGGNVYEAYILTARDGSLEKRIIVTPDNKKTPEFPYKISFPKSVVAKMNRCLANNYLKQLWRGPKYAQWHFSDEGIASYMGDSDISGIGPSVSILDKLISTNHSAAVLIAYLCFSVLKPFYPAYHRLNKQSPYLEAKKYLPQQFSVNIQGERLEDVKSLVSCCCGCFLPEKKLLGPIIDGIAIQKIPERETRLGVNEFETKMLQPASVLWVNRVPSKELMKDGRVVNLRALPISDDPLTKVGNISLTIVNSLAQTLHAMTVNSYDSFSNKNWEDGKPIVEKLLKEIDLFGKGYFSSVTDDERNRESKAEDEFLSPEKYIEHIRRQIQEAYQGYKEGSFAKSQKLSIVDNYVLEIQKNISDRLKKIREIENKNRKLVFSLDKIYQTKLHRLDEKSNALLSWGTIEKIAFLSASFHVLTIAIEATASPPISDKEKEILVRLSDKVEDILINVFISQMDGILARDVLERYLLKLMKENQYARIRGMDSSKDSIKVWYDPKEKTLLLPAKSYFDDLKDSFQIGDVSKNDFEEELVQADILRTVQRKKQIRRTFEIKVKKDTERMSVLKINVASLSDQFHQDAREFLEQMEKEETPYRS